MAFITRCCTRLRRPAQETARALEALLRAAWLVLALALAPALAQEPAEVTQLRAERREEGVMLSATVAFGLPAAVAEALAKGIPMYFVTEATVYRERWYWTDQRIASAVRHLRLSYQPLTRRWRVQVSSSPIGSSGLVLGQNFDTEEEALAAIQRISGWRVAEAGEIDPQQDYRVEFRFRLDVSQLPRPFQIGAVGQSDWNISATRSLRLAQEPAR